MELKSKQTPWVYPPRKVVHALKESLKMELNGMEKENILPKLIILEYGKQYGYKGKTRWSAEDLFGSQPFKYVNL